MNRSILNARLRSHRLEDRQTPTTFYVDNFYDSGMGSLRDAIANANSSPGHDEVVFDPIAFGGDENIVLTTGQIVISDEITISGPMTKLTINANKASRVFNIDVPGKSGQSIAISSLTLANGFVSGTNGGGILNNDEALQLTSVELVNCATNQSGGAIALTLDAASLQLAECTVRGNVAGIYGGGVYEQGSSTVIIQRSTLTMNSSGTSGGAIACNPFSTGNSLTIIDSLISGNKAGTLAVAGGGAICSSDANTIIRNSTFINNSAFYGGAIWGTQLAIQNCTIVDNVAKYHGGGIRADAGLLTVTSSIIAHNASPNGPDLYGSASASCSLIGNTFGALISGSGNKLNVDPLLDKLADNGGPSQTLMLLPGSPAINAGSNPGMLEYDQRGVGYPRVLNGIPDMGAIEGVRPEPIAVAKASDVSNPSTNPQVITVTYLALNDIDVSTLGAGDITITDPDGILMTPTFKGVDVFENGSPRVATYEFLPPGGAWDDTEFGTYVIDIAKDQVADTIGNHVPAETIGQFKINILPAPVIYVVTNTADSGVGSLRQAILDANAHPSSGQDSITFQSDVTGVITLSADLYITDAANIQGPGASSLALDRNSSGHIIQTATDDSNVVEIELTVSGLTLRDAGLTVTATTSGAAIRSYGTLTIRDCNFFNNGSIDSTTFSYGGAVFSIGTLVLERSTFANNGLYGQGGAVYAEGDVTIRDCSFTSNSEFGSFFPQSFGQGAALSASGNILVEGCAFSGNTGHEERTWGGAAAFRGNVIVRNSTFYNNFANSGGAIYVADGITILQNCTATENLAYDGPAYVGYGGGILVNSAATLQLQSSIVANNIDADGPDIYSGTVTADHSAIGDLFGITTYNDNGNNIPPGTPLGLGSFSNHGGLTKTISLSAGSPCIDAGNNPANANFDQRGTIFSRTVNLATDIGAFEVQNGSPLPTVTSIQVNDGISNQRSIVTKMTITFSENVSFPDGLTAAFTLMRTGAPLGGPLGSVNLAGSQLNNVVTLTFTNGGAVSLDPGNSLPDGKYTLTLVSSRIAGVGGCLDGNKNGIYQGSPIDDASTSFHRLFADNDGDAAVTSNDFSAFRQSFGTNLNLAFDFDGDGITDADDLAQLRKRFGIVIP